MSYDTPENKARHDLINPDLERSGWVIQHFSAANIHASRGVAVEFFQMGKGVGEADYVLFVDGVACGIIEAKKEGVTLIGKEPQSQKYAQGFPSEFESVELPLPFVYESTGSETRFTNLWDPKPRSREVFSFHRPETLADWVADGKNTLRKRLQEFPVLETGSLWPAQKEAIINLEDSFSRGKPRALIQMATGSGKTFTAVNICYRLIKHAGAKRILFLVDRGNLGKQTETEFETFTVPDDGRKFTELYNVHRLESNNILDSDKVVVSTIQRVYSMLKGEELSEEAEEHSSFEQEYSLEPAPVEYSNALPLEAFDFIIIDECHRSIYNLWKQVLDYFDAFLIGLTATPSKSTIGFFNKNLVMEYGHEKAVADQVNVDFDVYRIRTTITQEGSLIPKGENVLKRDKRTRRKRWEVLEDDVEYAPTKLDRDVVTPDQIRTVIRTFRDKVKTEIFPNRKHVPKTLIFAKSDAHAEEIVQIVREEFDEGNEFAQKITYKTEGIKPDDLIRQFRNEFYPRIAVTVDMIATGTDVKPLEVVFFMRSVKSRNYFEQMKGRGVRVVKSDEFKAVTPDGTAKDRFVIIDAVGVCESDELNETVQLDQNPSIPFPKLLKALQYGKPKAEYLSSMASRLSRLQRKLTEEQQQEISELTEGKQLSDYAQRFVHAIDEDAIVREAVNEYGLETYEEPSQKQIDAVREKRMREAVGTFVASTKLIERLPEIKAETEQIIDDVSIDTVEEAGFVSKERAERAVTDFRAFIEENKNELTAIQAFYSKGRLHWDDLTELSDKVKRSTALDTGKLWSAYKQVEPNVRGTSDAKRIADFISLLRYEIEKIGVIEPYADTVDKRFSSWLSRKIESGVHFTQEQLNWLEKMKRHVADSVEITADDFEDTPFVQMGGLGRAYKVFGEGFTELLTELNAELGV